MRLAHVKPRQRNGDLVQFGDIDGPLHLAQGGLHIAGLKVHMRDLVQCIGLALRLPFLPVKYAQGAHQQIRMRR